MIPATLPLNRVTEALQGVDLRRLRSGSALLVAELAPGVLAVVLHQRAL